MTRPQLILVVVKQHHAPRLGCNGAHVTFGKAKASNGIEINDDGNGWNNSPWIGFGITLTTEVQKAWLIAVGHVVKIDMIHMSILSTRPQFRDHELVEVDTTSGETTQVRDPPKDFLAKLIFGIKVIVSRQDFAIWLLHNLALDIAIGVKLLVYHLHKLWWKVIIYYPYLWISRDHSCCCMSCHGGLDKLKTAVFSQTAEIGTLAWRFSWNGSPCPQGIHWANRR